MVRGPSRSGLTERGSEAEERRREERDLQGREPARSEAEGKLTQWRAVLILVATILAVGTECTANPPPPIESTDSPKTTAAKPSKSSVVVAVDDIGIGFNPHLRSQQSAASSAVASMVLPSPFRPQPIAGVPGGIDWVMDPALMVSADVTAQEPFTITYQLKNE